MKYVLIRDDDVNYHTSFDMLKTVYGFIFDNDIAINFSVIPAINTAAKTASSQPGKQVYEPFLPQHLAGINQLFPICDNKTLVDGLLAVKRREFLLHGFDHNSSESQYEFETSNLTLLQQKIQQGIEIFVKAFHTRPATFVAPQDKYSLNAIRLIRDTFQTFSLGWLDKRRLPKIYLPFYYWMKLSKKNHLKNRDFLLTEHPGCLYSRYRPRQECDQILDSYLANHQFTVIVVHHWEFFDEGILNYALWRAFKNRIIALNADPEVKFITFSQLHKMH